MLAAKSAQNDEKQSLRRSSQSLRALFRQDFDLEDRRPKFASHKEPVMLGVVSDAIQYRAIAGALARRQQPAQVNPTQNLARLRRNPRDAIGIPDVGVDLAVNVFEL